MAIYFAQIGAGGPVKIGYCREPQRVVPRLASIQSMLPWGLVCRAVLADGTRQEEQALHQRFAYARMRGEWFYPVRELTSYVDAVEHGQPRPVVSAPSRI